jgi:hypothetical protein
VFVGAGGSEADDPYAMPDERIDIETKLDAGRLAITLSADTVAKNIRLLRRTKMFARTHLTPNAQSTSGMSPVGQAVVRGAQLPKERSDLR